MARDGDAVLAAGRHAGGAERHARRALSDGAGRVQKICARLLRETARARAAGRARSDHPQRLAEDLADAAAAGSGSTRYSQEVSGYPRRRTAAAPPVRWLASR